MTKLLTEVMRKIIELPEDRQDDAAHVLLNMIENDVPRFGYSATDLAEEEVMHASLRHYRIEPKNMDELVRRVPGAMEVISKLPTDIRFQK
jgi:hypothetical protein